MHDDHCFELAHCSASIAADSTLVAVPELWYPLPAVPAGVYLSRGCLQTAGPIRVGILTDRIVGNDRSGDWGCCWVLQWSACHRAGQSNRKAASNTVSNKWVTQFNNNWTYQGDEKRGCWVLRRNQPSAAYDCTIAPPIFYELKSIHGVHKQK